MIKDLFQYLYNDNSFIKERSIDKMVDDKVELWSDIIKRTSKEEGKTEGENKLILLFQKLEQDNQLDVYIKAMHDRVLLNQLYQKYGIE